MNNATIISAEDNVAVAIEAIQKGEKVYYGQEQAAACIAQENIPIYHKIAIRPIATGDKICKYGEHIGEALCDIPQGAHVHVHNVASVRENLDDK